MTVDPSPTRFWAIEWWVYQPSTEFRWLMDLERTPMEAGEFFDFNPATRQFTGLLDEWVNTSRELGLPITHVVEDNAAQRFLLQYDMVHQWMADARSRSCTPRTATSPIPSSASSPSASTTSSDRTCAGASAR